MRDEISSTKKELQEYPGEEIPVAEAVPIVARATGLRVHLLRDDEVFPALEHAKKLIIGERVREGSYELKKEIVKASKDKWAGLSPQARSIVGTLWSEMAGADLVITTIDPVQTKEKILSIIENFLEQKKRFPLGQRKTPT